MKGKAIFRCAMRVRKAVDAFAFVPVLVLIISLLLGACTEGNTGKKDVPVIFGNAGGGSGGGGATSGMSFSW
jgi:hypothetical protein